MRRVIFHIGERVVAFFFTFITLFARVCMCVCVCARARVPGFVGVVVTASLFPRLFLPPFVVLSFGFLCLVFNSPSLSLFSSSFSLPRSRAYTHTHCTAGSTRVFFFFRTLNRAPHTRQLGPALPIRLVYFLHSRFSPSMRHTPLIMAFPCLPYIYTRRDSLFPLSRQSVVARAKDTFFRTTNCCCFLRSGFIKRPRRAYNK